MADLDRYRRKRDFGRTGEPRPSRGRPSKSRPRFVIQEHDASTRHFDFRLEVDGVLKSWSSTDPREKRLAIRTEDHPLDYADFEGVIPQDQYGGGSVIVWDRGTYENITEKDGGIREAGDALEQGHLLVWLEGEKLRGGYALQRFRDEEDQWLLVKMKDDGADARRNPVSSQPESVASGRTVEEVARTECADENE